MNENLKNLSTKALMKRILPLLCLAFAAGSLLAADAKPKDVVEAAMRKLAEQANYSWRTTVSSLETNQSTLKPGPTDGKTEKGGYTCLALTRGTNTIEAVLKNGKGAMKTADGWKPLAETSKGTKDAPNPMRLIALMLLDYQVPTTQMLDLASKTKDLTLTNGIYTGELTDAGVNQLLSFRRAGMGGSGGPVAHNGKGIVQFSVKDGLISKCEFRLQGTLSSGGSNHTLDRTTVVEIKDVGTTKITVPEEAAKAASQ